jgi:hypothetical protein
MSVHHSVPLGQLWDRYLHGLSLEAQTWNGLSLLITIGDFDIFVRADERHSECGVIGQAGYGQLITLAMKPF